MDGMTEFLDAIYEPSPKKTVHARATVTRIDREGRVWVHFDGGADETPVHECLQSVRPGDSVAVTVSGGRATIGGNATDVPASSSKMVVVERTASSALENANTAHAAATSAIESAASAHEAADDARTAADNAQRDATAAGVAAASAQADATAAGLAAAAAQSDADAAGLAAANAQRDATAAGAAASNAQTSANTANTAANDALSGLSTVQGVVDALGRDVDDLQTHVALTDEGLFITVDGSGYRVRITNEDVSIVDAQGHTVATFGESITLDSSRPQSIGGEDAYILYYDSDGDGDPDSLIISGENVQIGGGKSLSDVISALNEPVYDHYFTETPTKYTFVATVTKAGKDVTELYHPSLFVWYLRTEDGDTLLGTGPTVEVSKAAAGYRGSVLGGLNDMFEGILVDDQDRYFATENGDLIAAELIWEV